MKNRTKYIISSKVIDELKKLKNLAFQNKVESFEDIISLYNKFNKLSKEKMNTLHEKHSKNIDILDVRLVNKALLKLEEKTIKLLFEKEFVTPKLYVDFMDTIEHKISRDVKIF